MTRQLIHTAVTNFIALNSPKTVAENITTMLSNVPYDNINNALSLILGIAETTYRDPETVTLHAGPNIEEPTIVRGVTPDFFAGTLAVHISFLYLTTQWVKKIPQDVKIPTKRIFIFKLSEWNTGRVNVLL